MGRIAAAAQCEYRGKQREAGRGQGKGSRERHGLIRGPERGTGGGGKRGRRIGGEGTTQEGTTLIHAAERETRATEFHQGFGIVGILP